MIRLTTKTLKKTEQDILDDLQVKIDTETTFITKAAKAQSLWDSKGGQKGKDAFKIIGDALYDMCVFTGLCNYCEQSEANDIEHIHPKSFFPAFTFKWENYILACKQCNSGHKLDKGYVLDAADNLVFLVRGNQPPHSRIAFINIRNENPQDFMLLNPFSHKFEIYQGLTKADKNKAEATLKVLELNDRDPLLAARKSAAKHYYEMIDRLGRILATTTIADLEALLNPYDDLFDLTKPLATLKTDITDSFKKYISNYQHPSVWATIKLVQSKTDNKWKELFQKVPAALTW